MHKQGKRMYCLGVMLVVLVLSAGLLAACDVGSNAPVAHWTAQYSDDGKPTPNAYHGSGNFYQGDVQQCPANLQVYIGTIGNIPQYKTVYLIPGTCKITSTGG